MPAKIKAKEFCLSDYGVEKVNYHGGGSFNTLRGKQQTNIGYMKRGSCVFATAFHSVELHAGEMIYIPEGTRYTSRSTGDPDVLYYCVHASFRADKDGTRFDQSFGMQKIEPLPSDEFGEVTVELHSLLEQGDPLSRLTSIGRFYQMYAALLPLLKEAEAPACSPAVIKALSYIEKHCCENYTTAELAKECFISESRLYHLFREELHTTPISYKNEMKILRSMEYIKTGYQTVEEISEMLGFRSAAYFRRVFKDITGMTPIEYRKKYSML